MSRVKRCIRPKSRTFCFNWTTSSDVTVSARENPVTGQVVAAKITLLRPEEPEAFKRRLRTFCRDRIDRYKTPALIEIVAEAHHGERFKKSRKGAAAC